MKRIGITVRMVLALIALLGTAGLTLADVTRVALKASVPSGSEGATLRMSDIAEIEGPERERIGSIAMLNVAQAMRGGAATSTITLADVREALESAGVNLGRIELSGAACQVQLQNKATVVAPRTKTSVPEARVTEARVHQTVDMTGPATLRTQITGRIAAMLNVSSDDIRLLFDEADEDLLSQAVGSRRVDAQPASGVASARVPMQVTVYDADRVVLSRVFSAGVLVKRTQVTATQVIERGTPIGPDQIEVAERWVSPATKFSVDPQRLAGAITNVRLQAGQVISPSDIGQPMVCKRGDLVYVHALSGGVTVKAKARAMSAARDGETVQLKLEGSDRVFSARMSGPGRAVLLVMPSDEPTGSVQGSNTSTLTTHSNKNITKHSAPGRKERRP